MSNCICRLAKLALSATFATGLLAQAEPARDYRAAAQSDIAAIHAALLANHPGPVDPQQPDFAARMQQRLHAAQSELAALPPLNAAAYVKTVRRYVTDFDDGHVSIQFSGPSGTTGVSGFVWPGFSLAGSLLADGSTRLEVNASTLAEPKVGARLHSCDGLAPKALMTKWVQPFWGQASVPHGTARLAWRLSFALAGDESGAQFRSCRFVGANGLPGEPIALTWQPISFAEAGQYRELPLLGHLRVQSPTATWSDLSPSVVRISVPTFGMNGDARKPLREAFEATLQRVKARQWAPSDALVVDVRGNTGGNSAFGRELVAAVWGNGAARQAADRLDWTVDWRASPENLARLLAFRDVLRKQDLLQSISHDLLVSKLQTAIERGEPFVRTGTLKPPASPTVIEHDMQARVVVLTDETCASACLDFLDLALAMRNARHAGLPTSADSLYMDVNVIELAEKRITLLYPMKVYRNRIRGHQAFYKPKIPLTASEMNDSALLNWIESQPPR